MSNYNINILKNKISVEAYFFLEKTINKFLRSQDRKENFKFCFDRHMFYLQNSKKLPFSKEEFEKCFQAKNFFKNFFDCGSYLEFRYYQNQNQTKLHSANFCQKDKLCTACAVRRAYRQQKKFLDIYESAPDLQELDWYYIVLPVRHNRKETFETVFQRLMRLKSMISKSIRDRTMKNFFSQFLGGMFSIETTKTENGWNVHLNLLMNAPKSSKIDFRSVRNSRGQVSYQNAELGLFLQKYAANSRMHNIQRLDFSDIDDLKSALVEIVKYALKFSSLSSQDLLIFFVKTYRKRLFGTFGNLRNRGLEDVQLDDDVVDRQWLEIIFIRTFYGYSLRKISDSQSLSDSEKSESQDKR